MIVSATLVGGAIVGFVYMFYKYVTDDKGYDMVHMTHWIDEQEKDN